MADAKVRGITIELGADTNGISKSLKDLNSEIGSTQKQLKDVERLLKLDPKNTDLLKQKQELLNKSIDASKQKVEALESAQKQLGDRTEENKDQYDAIQREIVACQDEQKKWTKELANANPEIEKIKAQFYEVSKATGKAAKNTKALSAVAAAGAGALLTNAYSAAKTADDINTLAKQYGVSTAEIQKMRYAQDLVDVSTEDMVGSMAKLTKQMGSEAKIFDTLGVSIKDTDGNLRDSTDVWYECLEALSKVGNETERDILAQELFGKSAASLSGIIDDGGEALKSLGEEAENAGLILSQDALDGANQFNDAMDRLKATASASFMEAGASLAETLIPALEKLVEVVTNVLTWFGNLDGSTQTIILAILGLVAAISPVLGIISTLTGLAAALNVAMLPMIGTIGAIVLAIAAVIAIGVALYQNWDTIKAKASELWTTVSTAFTNMVSAIGEKMTDVKTKVVEGFEAAIEYIKSLPEKAAQWGRDIIGGLIGGIGERIDDLVTTVSGVAGKIAGFLGFSEPEFGPLSNFHTFMPDMMRLMADGIKDNTWRVESAITGVAGTVASATKADYSPITGRLDSLIGATSGGTNVSVVLQGDAAGVFKLVRAQNQIFSKQTGRSGF